MAKWNKDNKKKKKPFFFKKWFWGLAAAVGIGATGIGAYEIITEDTQLEKDQNDLDLSDEIVSELSKLPKIADLNLKVEDSKISKEDTKNEENKEDTKKENLDVKEDSSKETLDITSADDSLDQKNINNIYIKWRG